MLLGLSVEKTPPSDCLWERSVGHFLDEWFMWAGLVHCECASRGCSWVTEESRPGRLEEQAGNRCWDYRRAPLRRSSVHAFLPVLLLYLKCCLCCPMAFLRMSDIGSPQWLLLFSFIEIFCLSRSARMNLKKKNVACISVILVLGRLS